MNIEEIHAEIASLEQADTNWQNIQKLAWLYTVKDHLFQDNVPIIANSVRDVMPEYAGEFGEAVSGATINELMNILSEHMSVIKILHPKEYQSVIDRIKKIPR